MRSLRRKEREITDDAIRTELLERAAVCRLGFSAADGLCDYPYVVPLHFAWHDGTIYAHCAREGLKLDLLARDARVCVEVDEMLGVVPSANPCNFSTRYLSLIGFGRARVVTDPAVKRQALDSITRKYGGTPPERWTEQQVGSIAVIAVTLERVTVKRAGQP